MRCRLLTLAGLCLALLIVPGGCAATSNGPQDERPRMDDKIRTFLMFEGQAEEAITFYVSLLRDSRILSIERYGPGEPGPEGSVKQALFTLAGRPYMTSDSYVNHDFTFTPSMSLFVTCESEAELDRLFESLSDGGQVFMPPENYGFSRKFAWLSDRFGVSWQLNLPAE